MTEKKNKSTKHPAEVVLLVNKKMSFFQDVIQRTILHVHKNKMYDILGISDVSTCINVLNDLSDKIKDFIKTMDSVNTDTLINNLQTINNDLSTILKNYGTELLDDLLSICFGSNNAYYQQNNETDINKFDLLRKYFHPTGYKVANVKKSESNDTLEDVNITEKSKNLDCYDISLSVKQFHTKVYGIKIFFYNSSFKKNLMIYGILDDVIIDFLNNDYLSHKMFLIKENIPKDPEFHNETFECFLSALTLKDYLIFNHTEIFSKYVGFLSNVNVLKQRALSVMIRDFTQSDLYSKRSTLIQLLIKSCKNYDNQYLAYLLYDLLSNDTNGNVDTQEQTILFDSFPWSIKKFFRDAMKRTIQYTNDLTNFDMNKIPLEQQICLLKANDNVKEKAMMKLKEVKAKSEDSGSKARQYLDGLLKIPFSVYKREPVLDNMIEVRSTFNEVVKNKEIVNKMELNDTIKDNYTSIEIIKCLNKYNATPNLTNIFDDVSKIKKVLMSGDKNVIISNLLKINDLIKQENLKVPKLTHSNKNKSEIKKDIELFIETFFDKNPEILKKLLYTGSENLSSEHKNIKKLNYHLLNIKNYISDVKVTLDKAVHGHDNAKKQIERIIGQWINGEQDGYCFGFEGPPGVGKCFAKNTPIMLSNGDIKMVQDISINDKLMGDDSLPRNVLALGSGIEKMYRIVQIKGDEYIVNESHILSLKMTKSGKKGDKHQIIMGKRYFKNDIIDISIKDYLGLPKYVKECLKGYKVGIDFPDKELSIEPYILGYWLGDGSSGNFGITTIDQKIIEHFKEYASHHNLKCTMNKITYSFTTGVKGGRSDKNILLNKMKSYNLINNKHIPEVYKCNSREKRLKLLAGLIDSDGYHNKINNALEITQKNKKLADDILWLVRSLGFRGMIKESIKSCTYKGDKKTGIYYRITITGKGLEEIPTLLERKKAREHKQIKDSLNTGIKVIPLEEDNYYGFQIDGNSRFLLGDFTVAHNTSLAKRGLADCLKDENGNSRPFAMIQMGGDSNGSTLHGHNYTYVGSTWGSIVQILIDKKCMNPIIFIDELDKISKTEHGKEIIGILTHLLDPTQNDCFQDKYFTGIDLDLSKALFILSYNDVEVIDKVLLDRIHRIKFSNLSLEDKLIIANTHILPEVYKKMGLEGIIKIDEDVLKLIIEEYTSEPGVRKLKEILFELVGDINLVVLKETSYDGDIPIHISREDIKNKYLKSKHEIKHKKIHSNNKIGQINGMWANAMGQGGIIPIQVKYYPADDFLKLKLTGMQGDVMKESMNVALTLAWDLTEKKRKEEIKSEHFSILSGVHIHCPEGSVPKDGPSAGTAITTSIYSLFNNKKIRHDVAITGEISLDGIVTEIGGLDLKILGGIKAGVKEFIYPNENKKDFDSFMEKYKDSDLILDIKFHPVTTIEEVFEIIFEK
jgi:ATP-dependent Lon protease